MTGLGLLLVVLGAVLTVAEAHMPSGALGIAGGAALIVGGVLVIAALGGGAAVAVPVGVGLGLAAGGWTLVVARHAAQSRRVPVRSGAEALTGRIGVVRRWQEPAGQVLVDGALWRARHQPMDGDDAPGLQEGDFVVVERVSGLTLRVRRAEEWELVA
jgi:membrane-bound serine protease (ClpP class)